MGELSFKLYLESSLDDLYSSAVEAFPGTRKRQHAIDPVRIVGMRWTPFLGLRTLFVRGLAQNEGRTYDSIILFKDVNYGHGIPIVASDGREYLLERLSIEDNDVLVRCNCGDFYWRGNFANYLDNSLFGRKRKKYESLGILPPANPTDAPMLCKHLMKLSYALRDAGIIV